MRSILFLTSFILLTSCTRLASQPSEEVTQTTSEVYVSQISTADFTETVSVEEFMHSEYL